eukprot:gb/GECG01014631.1/.p1 GENE.gb/GECG01014631.1/~~gb/GECG01014631.1/.p1  ORF type:complete len:540 (+),score=84.09 gb/GECG01014631.1/:1-1620(+)
MSGTTSEGTAAKIWKMTPSKSFSVATKHSQGSFSTAEHAQTRKSVDFRPQRPSPPTAQNKMHRDTSANPRVQLGVKVPTSPSSEPPTSVEENADVQRVSERLEQVSTTAKQCLRAVPSSPSNEIPTPLPTKLVPGGSQFDFSEELRGEGPPPPPPRPPPLPEKRPEDYTIELDPADPLPEVLQERKGVRSTRWKIFHPTERRSKKTFPDGLLDEEAPSLSPRDKYPPKKDFYEGLIKSDWEKVGKEVAHESNLQRRHEARNNQGAKNTHGVPNLNLSTVSKYQTEEEVQRESRRTYLEQLASLQWKSSNIALNSRRKWHNNGPEGEMRLVSPRPGAIPRFSLTKSPRKKGGSPGSNNASPGDGSGFPNITGTGNGPEVASPSSPSGGTDEAFHVTQATMPPNTHAYTANGASTVMRQPNTTLSVGASQQLDVNELERVGQPELAPVIISPKKYKQAAGKFENGNARQFYSRVLRQQNKERAERTTPVSTGLANHESTQSNNSILSKNSGTMNFLSAQDETSFQRDERTIERLYGNRLRI